MHTTAHRPDHRPITDRFSSCPGLNACALSAQQQESSDLWVFPPQRQRLQISRMLRPGATQQMRSSSHFQGTIISSPPLQVASGATDELGIPGRLAVAHSRPQIRGSCPPRCPRSWWQTPCPGSYVAAAAEGMPARSTMLTLAARKEHAVLMLSLAIDERCVSVCVCAGPARLQTGLVAAAMSCCRCKWAQAVIEQHFCQQHDWI